MTGVNFSDSRSPDASIVYYHDDCCALARARASSRHQRRACRPSLSAAARHFEAVVTAQTTDYDALGTLASNHAGTRTRPNLTCCLNLASALPSLTGCDNKLRLNDHLPARLLSRNANAINPSIGCTPPFRGDEKRRNKVPRRTLRRNQQKPP